MASKFNLLKWAPAWEIGVAEIDDDRRLLVDDSNDLIKALMEERPKPEIMTIARRMESACREHFRREETILREAQYDRVDEHAAEHRRIERELGKAIRTMAADNVSVNGWDKFILFIQSTLVNHFLLFDLKFKSLLMWERGR